VEKTMPPIDNLPTDLGRFRILDLRESAAFVGLEYSSWRALYARNETPRAVKIGARKLGWRLGDLVDWIEARTEPEKTAQRSCRDKGGGDDASERSRAKASGRRAHNELTT
jgi:predicted DNA-binding transcriptional regulator AlpA